MIELLARAAAAAPDQVAVVTPEGSHTYAELHHDAEQIAAALRAHGTGPSTRHLLTAESVDPALVDLSRFAIVEPDAAWVIRLLAGAALAGAEPCQYQPDTPVAELLPQLATPGHDVVITRRDDLVDPLSAAGISVVRPESLLTASTSAGSASYSVNTCRVDGLGASTSAGSAQPLLIRTTGTTGEPKAARHDWGILARTVESVQPRPHQRWLLAYGPHQFAGVQVLLHAIAAQATLVAPFPRQPRDGLTALLDEGITCVSATPTYWRFLLAEARSRGVAPPALEQVTLGGEAIPPDLLDELTRAFPTARIAQVYASTEFGSIVSVGDGRAGFSIDKLFSRENPEARLKVVDGELWVRRTPGMLGYAGRPASGDDQPEHRTTDDWNPTGDLVEVVGDRVEFRGRDSEVINVGGVKVHPLPVENLITALDGVAAARVFGRANKLTGAIVAAEIVPIAGADEETLRRDVKVAVADLPRAWHPRSITLVDAIETHGSKTLRRTES